MSDTTKKGAGKLLSLCTGSEPVYRACRTFLQAAIGAGAAGLVELLSGKFAGASPGRVFLYFIAVAVAAGLSAVMNRSGKKLPEGTGAILEELTEGLSELGERLEGKDDEAGNITEEPPSEEIGGGDGDT